MADNVKSEVDAASRMISLVAQLLIRQEDLLAAILSLSRTSDHARFEEWTRDGGEIRGFDREHPENSLLIPREKIGEFYDLTHNNGGNIPWMIYDPSLNQVKGSGDFHLDRDSKMQFGSEYVAVIYRGPKHETGPDGTFTDKIIPGSDHDEKLVKKYAEQVTREYLKEKEAEIMANPALNTLEADQVFEGVKVSRIEGLSLSEAGFLQDLSSKMKVESFMLLDRESGKYALEYDDADLMRKGFPAHMTVGAELLSDFRIALSVPQIKEHIEMKDRNHELLSFSVGEARVGNGSPDIVCVNLDCISMHMPPERFEICGRRAVYHVRGNDGGFNGVSYDLTDPKQYGEFKDRFSSCMKDYAVLDRAAYEGIYLEGDRELYASLVSSCLIKEVEYEKLKDSVLSTAASLRESSQIALKISDDPDKSGYRAMEERIPDSDKVITHAVCEKASKDCGIKIDRDEMRQNLNLQGNSLKVTGASRHVATASFLKKDAHELILDANSYGTGSTVYGTDEALSPAEIQEYCESVNAINLETNGYSPLMWYEDLNHDGADDRYQTVSELYGDGDFSPSHDDTLDEPDYGSKGFEDNDWEPGEDPGDGFEFDWEPGGADF